jgi:hypothetical protein
MDALDVIRHVTKRAWDWLEYTVVRDITEEQANWRPPGTANTIGATYAHTIVCADEDINRVMYGRPTLLESRWNGQAGLGKEYRFGEWNAFDPKVGVEWGTLRQYARDVHAWLLESVGSLTEADLQMPVDMSRSPGGSSLGQWKGIDVYFLHGTGHIYIHGGEIACLKGMQGQRGYVGGFRPGELFP